MDAVRHLSVYIFFITTLRSGDRVWIVDGDGLLRIREAQVVRAMQERILAYVDMAHEDRIVTSQLNGVTDGMQVRLASAQ